MKQALLGLGLGVVLARVGLAGSEGVIRAFDGADFGLLALGLLAAVLLSWPWKGRPAGWGRALGAGALIGVGLGCIGAVPLTLAASLGEGKLLALPLLAVVYAGWRVGARWEPLSETAPGAPPAPERSEDGHLDSETDSAE